jgi:hypothetical protein
VSREAAFALSGLFRNPRQDIPAALDYMRNPVKGNRAASGESPNIVDSLLISIPDWY